LLCGFNVAIKGLKPAAKARASRDGTVHLFVCLFVCLLPVTRTCPFVCLSPTRRCRPLAHWRSSVIVLAGVTAAAMPGHA